MNPSAKGWIKKHLPSIFHLYSTSQIDDLTAYKTFRDFGFIYGTSIKTYVDENSTSLRLTEEEKTKVNLFDALVYVYYDTIENSSPEDCVKCVVEFYEIVREKKTHFFKFVNFGKSNDYETLEEILNQRIQTNESFIKKNFSHLITNALLFLDVLAFEHYLIYEESPLPYVEKLEATLVNTVCLALDQKEDKQSYDDLLLKLFRSSVRYNELIDDAPVRIEDLQLENFKAPLERLYLLDLACLAIWDDNEVDTTEFNFIYDLGFKLGIEAGDIKTSLDDVHNFIESHKDKIALFQYSNPVKHFYKQTNRTVKLLIIRNKKRLVKEISESKELVILLGHSTLRELNEEEKTKVKNQLLDICKTIPSLAIFILPGGSLLLPLLIKMIPKLLPSAFNENLE